MKESLFIITLVLCGHAFTQNVAINTTGAAAVTSAALDVDIANKGILIPRVALTGTATFAPVTGTATTSLMVYNTATAGSSPTNVTPGYYYWNGSSWERFVPKSEVQTSGDVKYGFQTSDHGGWIKMDGRAISTLTTTQQAAATALGFSGNIPNATDRVIKQKATLNSTGGANSVTLSQSNLPNVSLSGTAATAGAHSHTGTTSSDGGHTHTHTDYYYAENNGANWGWAGSSSGMDWDNRGYSTTGTTSSNGAHTHTFTTSTDSGHTHTVSVSLGGSATAVATENSYLGVNAFIFLGY